MRTLDLFFRTSGRIAPKPFVAGALVVYLLSFLSQFLLASPVTARVGIAAFLLVQSATGGAWYMLHAGRLRDSGRSAKAAAALSVIYVLAVLLLLLTMAAVGGLSPSGPADEAPVGWLTQTLLPLYLTAVVLSDPNPSVFSYVVVGLLFLTILPIMIAIVFTASVALRPSVRASS